MNLVITWWELLCTTSTEDFVGVIKVLLRLQMVLLWVISYFFFFSDDLQLDHSWN